jgi:hypothetical protein
MILHSHADPIWPEVLLKVGRTQNKQNEILIMALTSPNIKQMVAKEIPRLGSRSSETNSVLII